MASRRVPEFYQLCLVRICLKLENVASVWFTSVNQCLSQEGAGVFLNTLTLLSLFPNSIKQ